MLVSSFVPQKAREAKASRFVTTLLAQGRWACAHSALQQLAADKLPLIFSGLDFELGADVHWLMRSAGSALQQLAADNLPLIFKAGSGLDCELRADVHWLMRSAGSALQQLAADKLPLIFKAGSGLDFELRADNALVDAVCWLSFAAAGCG
ncbi:hypothetical protein [Aeromonas sp. QDB05]|uniref:hypothetical protein n=1 Tax=Aeromonas sp. QDB05 TaxID=2990478 RepID=UPI003FA43780